MLRSSVSWALALMLLAGVSCSSSQQSDAAFRDPSPPFLAGNLCGLLAFRDQALLTGSTELLSGMSTTYAIEIATAMQKAYKESKPGSFRDSYAKNHMLLDALAAKGSGNQLMTEPEKQGLLQVRMALFIDAAKALREQATVSTRGAFASAYQSRQNVIEMVAGKDWATDSVPEEQRDAVCEVVAAGSSNSKP